MIFYLTPFLFLNLNPYKWQQSFREGDSAQFVVIQLLRFFAGLAFAFFLSYLILIDQTLPALFISLSWIVGILLIVDGIFEVETKGNIVQIIFGGVVFLTFLYSFFIYPFTIYKDLNSLVQVETVADQRLEAMDIEHIVVVPKSYAEYKGEKLLGQVKNYSYYEIGEYTKQKIGSQLYWVAPIIFEGYFTSKKAEIIEGYIKISAEDETKSAELITGYKMKYVPSAYFGNNLYRMVRNQFPDILIMEASFEPDDNGKPYYAVSYGYYEKFREGQVVDGVILFDPETGSMKKYPIDKVPSFIDHVMPGNVAGDYNIYFGEYKNGFLNTWFAKKDMHTPTVWDSGEEVVGVFGPDQKMYWFTDHTTLASNATSMVGYSLMDARNGKMAYYTGVKGFLNGYSALEVVTKTFKKEEWVGTQPLLYNIYGQDTWVIPVVDGNGLLREIALIHAETGQIVHATNKKELFDLYKMMIATNQIKTDSIPTNVSNLKEIEGKVLRVNQSSGKDGETLKMLLEGNDKIFMINTSLIPYSIFTSEGDIVKIKYINNEETIVTVKEFINKTINH